MAEILVLYATVEGHSAKIAERISSYARGAGHQVVVADLKALRGQSLPACDAVVLVVSVHFGRHVRRVGGLVRPRRG